MKYILTDIEGTTTSISFVHEVLFPYSKEKIESFVIEKQNDISVKEILNNISGNLEEKIKTLHLWISLDKKEKPLKDLQGLIWEQGYVQGEIKGHVYPEVKANLEKWKNAGITLGVYSSGSIHAQKLLFKYSIEGNLDNLFTHNFDTSIGQKREAQSYLNIISILKIAPSDVLFLSDIVEELDAAKTAGMKTMHLIRLDDTVSHGHDHVNNFNQIKI